MVFFGVQYVNEEQNHGFEYCSVFRQGEKESKQTFLRKSRLQLKVLKSWKYFDPWLFTEWMSCLG